MTKSQLKYLSRILFFRLIQIYFTEKSLTVPESSKRESRFDENEGKGHFGQNFK